MRTEENPYEDQECIDAFLDSRENEVAVWQEENLEMGAGIRDPEEYLYEHATAFDDFSYNYYEDRAEGIAERRRELLEDR